jgi:hypothetical protein
MDRYEEVVKEICKMYVFGSKRFFLDIFGGKNH